MTKQLIDNWNIHLDKDGKFEYAMIWNALETLMPAKIGPLGTDEKSHINEVSQTIPQYNKKIRSFTDILPTILRQYTTATIPLREFSDTGKSSSQYPLGAITLNLDFGSKFAFKGEAKQYYFEAGIDSPVIHIITVYNRFTNKPYNQYTIWSKGEDSKTHAFIDHANNCGYIYRESFRDTIEFDIERDFSMKYYGLTSFVKYHSRSSNNVSSEISHLDNLPMMLTSTGLFIADKDIKLSREVIKDNQYNFTVTNYFEELNADNEPETYFDMSKTLADTVDKNL